VATAEQIENRKQVLSFIEAFPEFHDQDGYFCGTTACVAGTAIMFDKLKTRDSVISCLEKGKAEADKFDVDNTNLFDEFDRAVILLGLTEYEANDLFYCWDDAMAVERLRELAAEEPEEDE